jgi:preprotein translocase subunit SecA
VEQIKAFGSTISHLSINDVKNRTAELKKKFEGLDFQKPEDSEKIKALLEEVKVEAFALVKHTASLLA